MSSSPLTADGAPRSVGSVIVKAEAQPAVRSARDLRLDFFRGLALWFIFLDHIPDNFASWFTVRNYGFSDAAEIFVYISGYAALVAYSRILVDRGWLRATARILRRVWQLYVAHIMLFVAFTAQIAWAATRTGRRAFLEDWDLLVLMDEPTTVIVDTALLKFRPVGLDVLPLYIVLLAGFALILPAIRRWPWTTLVASGVLYLLARHFEWNLPGHAEGSGWYFDPFTWQFLFCAGAAIAADGRVYERLRRYAPVLFFAAMLYLVFAGLIALSWEVNALGHMVPDWLGRLIYPIDKTMLDPLRLVHFFALAYIAGLLVPADATFLRSWPAEIVRRCGEHSLPIFCIGTFLSFTAYIVITERDNSVLAQVGVSFAGIALMVAAAYIAGWFKKDARGGTAPGGDSRDGEDRA